MAELERVAFHIAEITYPRPHATWRYARRLWIAGGIGALLWLGILHSLRVI